MPTLHRIFSCLRLLMIALLFIAYTKKRDCTVAVPLHEALALPIIPNKQHRSPRRYVRTRTPALIIGVRIWIYISRGHQNAAMCWNNVRICEIPCSQAQSAYDAFIMSCNCPP